MKGWLKELPPKYPFVDFKINLKESGWASDSYSLCILTIRDNASQVTSRSKCDHTGIYVQMASEILDRKSKQKTYL